MEEVMALVVETKAQAMAVYRAKVAVEAVVEVAAEAVQEIQRQMVQLRR